MTSRDETFRNFTASQAATYAKFRGSSYPPALYQAVLDYHAPTARNVVYDIGTGPGKVAFDLLPFFARAIGSDTSAQMVAQAQHDAAARGVGGRTRFAVCGAETCCTALTAAEVGAVDLITVAMAAHWFELPAFYAQAARALTPGRGTLAVWTCSSFYAHPADPQARAIQGVLSFLEDDVLGPFMAAGNRLSRGGYRDLPLPWQVDDAALFAEDTFVRRDWDVGGVPSAPDLPDGTPGPYVRMQETNIDEWEEGFEAASPVTRWRQANPEKVGTDKDPLRIVVGKLRAILGERKTFLTGSSCSLLLFRRSGVEVERTG